MRKPPLRQGLVNWSGNGLFVFAGMADKGVGLTSVHKSPQCNDLRLIQ